MRALEQVSDPGNLETVREASTSAIPLGRYGEASDIANLVVFLASDERSFIATVRLTYEVTPAP